MANVWVCPNIGYLQVPWFIIICSFVPCKKANLAYPWVSPFFKHTHIMPLTHFLTNALLRPGRAEPGPISNQPSQHHPVPASLHSPPIENFAKVNTWFHIMWITMDHYVSVWVNMAWITPILDVVQLAAVGCCILVPSSERTGQRKCWKFRCESRSCILLSLQCPWGSWSSYVGWMSARSKISMGQIFISRTLGRWRLKPIWMHRSCPCLGCNSSWKASCLNS